MFRFFLLSFGIYILCCVYNETAERKTKRKRERTNGEKNKNSHVIILFLFYSVLLGIIQSFNNTNAYKNINSTEKKQNENL